MHILVTNDDGIQAPGLLALAMELSSLGDLTVLAPDHNWSACGHVKTLDRPLRVKDFALPGGIKGLSTDGAPSDCVALAALGLLKGKIDMVVSGINPSANLGHDITYSGTVTAAMEAAIWGLPGVAVSLDTPEGYMGAVDYTTAARAARRVVKGVIDHTLPADVFLNLNVPYLPEDEIKGYLVTRQGLRVYRDVLDIRQDPRGRPYYWFGGEAPTGIPDEGTDFGALAAGCVSITPLQLDLTARGSLDELRQWRWDEK